MIEFRNISVAYGDKLILKDISFSVPEGSITALIGPNGCGKTTLLRAAAGQLPLRAGEILLCGKPVSSYERRELARTAAFMPQVRSVPAITAGALVAHGRFPHLGFSRRMQSRDIEAVHRAMKDTGVAQWAHRDLRSLSGGERQRVYLAMALAQDTKVIFLDEPTTYLDLHYQFEILELASELNRRGKTVMMVLHDLSHALTYSHQVVLMDEGRVVQYAPPDALWQSGSLEQVFGVCAHRGDGAYYFTHNKKDG